jgi:hypothetical protein
MDCKAIRLLLPYLDLPGELSANDIAFLEGHLAACHSCRELAERERAFDASVTRAMSDVDVPSSLRHEIEEKLAVRRQGTDRRQLVRRAALISLAAVVLLALSIPLGWWTPRVSITAEQLLQDDYGDIPFVLSRNFDAAEEFFRGRGLKTELPRDFDYSLLVDLEVVNFRGHEVARLDFQSGQDRARVYVLPRKQFNVPASQLEADGSQCRVEIIDSARDYIYIVVLFGNANRQMFIPKALIG